MDNSQCTPDIQVNMVKDTQPNGLVQDTLDNMLVQDTLDNMQDTQVNLLIQDSEDLLITHQLDTFHHQEATTYQEQPGHQTQLKLLELKMPIRKKIERF